MSTINNSQIYENDNAIAAQKLSSSKTGSRKNMGPIKLPEKIYTPSSDEYVKEMQELRKQAARDRVKREIREEKIKNFQSVIKAVAFCSFVYILIKNINLNKFFK